MTGRYFLSGQHPGDDMATEKVHNHVQRQILTALARRQFGKQEDISYASFCNWCKRLGEEPVADSASPVSWISLIDGRVEVRSRLEHCSEPWQQLGSAAEPEQMTGLDNQARPGPDLAVH
jgi:hypothetical protein